MKTRGTTPEESAALLTLVEALQRGLESDERLRTAWTGLQRLGVSVVLRVELAPGAEPPRVAVGEKRPAMPQWSDKDVDVLHSVGISGEPSNDAEPLSPQSRRRQPR